MAKLYPPNIQGVIPAFYGTTLVVPFSMNRAVSEKEISGFQVKIKTISGIVKHTISTESLVESVDFNESEITFKLPEKNDFKVGQFYKIQIAYLGKDEQIPGYYSTVGIAKYTTEPKVYIEGLDANVANTHIYNYVGVYSQETEYGSKERKDASEKLYSSRFLVWDDNKNLYKDTGEIIHNTTKDVATYESTELFSLLEDLEEEKVFYIQFQITTVNYLHMKTPKYRIKQRHSINPEQKVYISAEQDFVNGCINLSMHGDGQETVSGSFVISRADSKHNFMDWEEIFNFNIPHAIDPRNWYAKDYSAEQGVYYKYAIQQYNDNGVYSEKTMSKKVYSDFEDSFLYDGEKLLNIRYNPKVTSFKVDLQENKQDTIGSQFPYIFRNGHINYKEFPISGLVSYWMDVDGLFMDKEKLSVYPETTFLTSENIASERDFKIEVLQWLTNGKPKLFKSPAEGNYIVRLMNTSLAPSDALNRMLHTFTSTAYEVMEYNAQNLREWGMIGSISIPDPIRAMKTLSLSDIQKEIDENFEAFKEVNEIDENGFLTLVSSGVKSINLSDLPPGTLVKIDDNIFSIGSTGSFSFNGEEDSKMKKVSIKIPEGTPLSGSMNYTYAQYTNGYFDLISSLKTVEIPVMQFFGNFYNRETLVDEDGTLYNSNNIYDFLQDARTTITKMYMIRLQKRDVEEIFLKPDDVELFNSLLEIEPKNDDGLVNIDFSKISFYKNRECTDYLSYSEITCNKFYPIRVGYPEEIFDREKNVFNNEHFMYEGYYVNAIDSEICPYIDYAIDGLSLDYFKIDDTLYKSLIDGVDVHIGERSTYEIPLPENVSSIEIGKGVTAELSFTKMTNDYTIEETIPKLRALKQEYLKLLENALVLDADYKYYLTIEPSAFYLEYKNNSGNNGGKIESSEALRIAYYKYMQELSKQLKIYKEKNQIL